MKNSLLRKAATPPATAPCICAKDVWEPTVVAAPTVVNTCLGKCGAEMSRAMRELTVYSASHGKVAIGESTICSAPHLILTEEERQWLPWSHWAIPCWPHNSPGSIWILSTSVSAVNLGIVKHALTAFRERPERAKTRWLCWSEMKL